jgi:23S rRNA (adenine2503-C2)-methyltransferase
MIDVKSLKINDLIDFFEQNNLPKFRAKQVYEWLWKKNVSDFEQMKNLPKNIRALLAQNFTINCIRITYQIKSKIDNSTKFAFATGDNLYIEGVLIPSSNNKRVTACISTQVGCPLGCKFCATGTMGFRRNLTAAEIYEQVFLLNQQAQTIYNRKLTNIVVMGMGEPLLNYDNLITALDFVTSKNGLEMSPSRITVSSVGLVKQIRKLADDKHRFNLAISLHNAIDSERSDFMPVNKKNNLHELIEALKYFYQKTGKRITFEYLLIHGITDTLRHAKALSEFCKNFPSKINLIEFNPVQHIDYQRSNPEDIKKFYDYIANKNLVVTIRRSKGQDINAACGQLAIRKQK